MNLTTIRFRINRFQRLNHCYALWIFLFSLFKKSFLPFKSLLKLLNVIVRDPTMYVKNLKKKKKKVQFLSCNFLKSFSVTLNLPFVFQVPNHTVLRADIYCYTPPKDVLQCIHEDTPTKRLGFKLGIFDFSWGYSVSTCWLIFFWSSWDWVKLQTGELCWWIRKFFNHYAEAKYRMSLKSRIWKFECP